jgi:uncharacterized RDD family membrane protein YckC
MPATFRQLMLGAAIAVFFTTALALIAQETPAPVPPPPKVAPAAEPAAPPTAAEPPAPPAPAVAEPPLRRLDEAAAPAAAETVPEAPKAPVKKKSDRRRSEAGGAAEAPFGDHKVNAGSETSEAVSILGSTRVDGKVRNDAVSVLGSTFVGPAGEVGGAAVAVLGKLDIQGKVSDEAVSVLGGVTLNGRVGGELVAVLGNIDLGPKAVVEGDLVIVGGRLTKHPDAVVRGNEVKVPFPGHFGDVEWILAWFNQCLMRGRPLAFGPDLGWAWLVAFGFLGFYALLALLFPKGIDRCVATFEERPGYSILASVLTTFLAPVAIVLLLVTVVGLVVVPFAGAGLFAAGLFGKAVMLAWIGRRLTGLAGPGALRHPVFAVLIGGLIVMLLYTLWGSFLLYKLLGWLGVGVTLYTLLLAMKREKPAPAAPGGESGPAAPASVIPPVAPAPVPASPVAAPLAAFPVAASGFVAPAAAAPDPVVVASPTVVPEAPVAPPVVLPAPATAELPAPPPIVSSGFVGAGSTPPPPIAPAPAPAAAAPVPPPVAPVPPSVAALPAAVAATLPRASFWLRMGALLIDAILIGILTGMASGLLPRFLQFGDGPSPFLLALALYGAVMWKLRGTTIGGIICGLRVVRVDGREFDWPTVVVRALSCFLSLMVGGLGFIWIAIDSDRQGWHDKIAGTTVVRVPKGTSLM